MSHLQQANDPIFRHVMLGPIGESAGDELPGWYFWDETWSKYHGPFGTREDAVDAMQQYVEAL